MNAHALFQSNLNLLWKGRKHYGTDEETAKERQETANWTTWDESPKPDGLFPHLVQHASLEYTVFIQGVLHSRNP